MTAHPDMKLPDPADLGPAPPSPSAPETAARRRVLFVVPSLRQGGAEMQVVRLVNRLDAQAFEAHLLYYDEGEALLELVDRSKVAVHALRKQGRLDFGVVSAMAQVIDAHRIEVVHCTIQYSLLLAWLARRKAAAKPRLVCAIHTTVNRTALYELFDRTLYRWMLRSADTVIFVCRSQLRYWLNRCPELEPKARVVFNGIDTAVFDPALPNGGAEARTELGIPAGALVVTCVAAFRPEKGHDKLLRAFAAAAAGLPETYLVLAGDGPTRPAARQLAAELGISERVKFPGPVTNVRRLLAGSDVTVLASTAVETFSIAMLESMAMAVPMVATDMGGTREAVLEGETGLLVPPGDVGALARALTRILGDPDLRARLGRDARTLVVNRFTEEKMVRETEQVLQQAASVVPRSRVAEGWAP